MAFETLERAKAYIEERWGNCAVVGSLLLTKVPAKLPGIQTTQSRLRRPAFEVRRVFSAALSGVQAQILQARAPQNQKMQVSVEHFQK